MIAFKFLQLWFDRTEIKLYPRLKSYLYHQRLYSSTKYTINIMPEIEKELDSGEMKHRKHPGIRKMAPIVLPPFIVDAIYRLVSDNHESAVLKRAKQLHKEILSRRLPVEYEEIQNKIQETSLELDGLGESIPEIVKKKRILELKRQLQMDIGRWKYIEYDAFESLCYLAGRAVPNYASTFRVFTELTYRIPSFKPTSFFDFGSGIGSALWATNTLWSDSIKEYFAVDSSPYMNDLSQSILTNEETEEKLIQPVHYRQFLPASEKVKYDLVVSAFSLMELSSIKERLQVVDTLWRKTKDIMVIIEQGNLAGFSTVLDARDYVLHIENEAPENFALSPPSGAHVVCPCPHDVSCPLVKKYRDPCSSFVTYQTIFPRQRFVFQKDFISYVVLRKGPRPQDDAAWPRIVKPVLKKPRHCYCRLCCSDGALYETVATRSKHGKNAYRAVRSSQLGDMLPANIQTLADDIQFPEEIFKDSHYFESDDDEENKT